MVLTLDFGQTKSPEIHFPGIFELLGFLFPRIEKDYHHYWNTDTENSRADKTNKG